MSQRKKDINDMAGSVRALCQGNCAPNHYWDMKTNTPGQEGAVRADGARSQAVRHRLLEVVLPLRSGPERQRLPIGRRGYLTYPFYEKSKQLGIKLFSVHKGFSAQSKTLGHLANPKDVEKAALDHPDLTS